MAHFEDDSHRRISGQNLPIRVGHRRTIFLWGGVVNGTPLRVISGDPSVLDIQETPQPANSVYRSFTLRALRDADSANVTVSPNADGSAPWDTVTFLIHTAAESGEYYRTQLISTARLHLGAHYLWGAAGASPDELNGMPGRPGSVHILTSPSPGGAHDVQHSVAVSRVVGFCACAGNPWKYNHPNDPPYISDAAHADLSQESETHSYRTVYKSYSNPQRKGVILGEKCEGKRHFDCVGFINFCLSTIFGSGVQAAICGTERSRYRGDYANGFPIAAPNEPHKPGDILIFGGQQIEFEGRQVLAGAHHIGFSLGDGTHMIHASETEYGVVISGIGRDLTRRVRHPRLA